MALRTDQMERMGFQIWEPQPGPQALAVGAHFVDELLFGGARGGGKSDYLLGDFLQDISVGVAWRGIIFVSRIRSWKNY
jgi:hypothetical protein